MQDGRVTMLDMSIGERVKALRQQHDWSQGQLLLQATRFMPGGEPFDRSTLSRLENGERNPSAVIVVALAQALSTSTDYLLGLAADPSPTAQPAYPVPLPDVAPFVAALNALPDEPRRRLVGVGMAILDLLGNR